MKKTLITLCLVTFLLAGCKNEKKEGTQAEETPTENTLSAKDEDVITGEFYFTEEAAILNNTIRGTIYGVVLDSMAKVLADKVEPIKRDEFDMVPVTVKGKIKPNPEKDGWDEVIEITKIINISKPESDDVIKIDGSQKNS